MNSLKSKTLLKDLGISGYSPLPIFHKNKEKRRVGIFIWNFIESINLTL